MHRFFSLPMMKEYGRRFQAPQTMLSDQKYGQQKGTYQPVWSFRH